MDGWALWVENSTRAPDAMGGGKGVVKTGYLAGATYVLLLFLFVSLQLLLLKTSPKVMHLPLDTYALGYD